MSGILVRSEKGIFLKSVTNNRLIFALAMKGGEAGGWGGVLSWLVVLDRTYKLSSLDYFWTRLQFVELSSHK